MRIYSEQTYLVVSPNPENKNTISSGKIVTGGVLKHDVEMGELHEGDMVFKMEPIAIVKEKREVFLEDAFDSQIALGERVGKNE